MAVTTLADAEATADRLVADLRRETIPDDEILRRLAATARPYFVWAAAWSTLQGRLAGADDDETRRALTSLRAVERAVSALDAPAIAPDAAAERSAEVPRPRRGPGRQREQAVGHQVRDALVALENTPDEQRRRRAGHAPVTAPQAR